MQGLADGYFILPYTIGDYLATSAFEAVTTEHEAFEAIDSEVRERIEKLVAVRGTRPPDTFHRELGSVMWDYVGMGRTKKGLEHALGEIRRIREEYWKDVNVVGSAADLNAELERGLRIADYLELSELIAIDALSREESCGGHFREEHQTPEGEAARNDKKFAYVAAWEFTGESAKPALHKERLAFEYVKPSQRSYK
jgi:succinate dehydrogenase / fumarate reductase flavoprotein subunit